MGYFIQSIFVIIVAFVVLHYTGKTATVTSKLLELYHGKKGCLPLGDLGNVTLHYFKVRGRGEAIRLLMEDNRISYKEKLHTMEEWPLVKQEGLKSGLLVFGQVPAIETKDIILVQSHAIMHLLGRSVGLDCDCEDTHVCEVLAYGVEDTRSKLSKMLHDPNFSLAQREDYIKNVLPTWLTYWEKLAPPLTAVDNCYFVGDRLTWVDYLIFDMLEINVEFSKFDFGEGAAPAAFPLTRFPKLMHFYKRFSSRPNIHAYINRPTRLPYRIPNQPK